MLLLQHPLFLFQAKINQNTKISCYINNLIYVSMYIGLMLQWIKSGTNNSIGCFILCQKRYTIMFWQTGKDFAQPEYCSMTLVLGRHRKRSGNVCTEWDMEISLSWRYLSSHYMTKVTSACDIRHGNNHFPRCWIWNWRRWADILSGSPRCESAIYGVCDFFLAIQQE